MIIAPAEEDSALTLNWIKKYNSSIVMKRCGCEGIAMSIFQNMGWNKDYKYQVVGEQIEIDGKKLIAFYLDDYIIRVPAKKDEVEEDENSGIMSREVLPQDTTDIVADELDGDVDKNLSRSRAIYFDDEEAKQDKSFSVDELGDERFNPDVIRKIIRKGTKPVEGWFYLDGMAVMTNKGFDIFPADWSESFGTSIYDRENVKLNKRMEAKIESPYEYGWTVGLDLPTMETVNKAIDSLRGEQNVG